jgi:hypothetical protein
MARYSLFKADSPFLPEQHDQRFVGPESLSRAAVDDVNVSNAIFPRVPGHSSAQRPPRKRNVP